MWVSVLTPARPEDPWYWRWARPALFVVAGLLVVALAGRGLVTLVEANETVAELASIQSIPVLWNNFLTALTTGLFGDRVAVAVAGAVVLVAQLGKLISIVGLGLFVWELAHLAGKKVGLVKIVKQDAGPHSDANSKSE